MRRRLVWLIALVPLAAPLVAFALAQVVVDPSSLSFAGRCVRTSADAKTVTVTNDGSPEAIDVAVRISPSSRASTFPLAGETARETLAPDDAFSFSVGFAPEVAGTASADAIVSYKVVATPTKTNQPTPSPSPTRKVVPVTGSGIDRFVDVSPKALNFGAVRVGRDAEAKTITIYDDGDSPLTVKSISLAGRHPGDFSVNRTGPATVTDGKPLKVSLGFSPSKAGARAAKLVVTTDACEDATVTIDLAGIGVVPDIVASPTEVDFGQLQVDKRARETLQIQNAGQWPLRITKMRITGKDAARFGLQKVSLPQTLRSGQVLSLRVTFLSDAPQPVAATLRISSSDPDTKVLKVPLKAEAVMPSPSPTPTPTPTIEPTIAPPPPDDGFDISLGAYASEIAVGGGVVGFFLLLVVVRRLKGIPE